MVTTSRPAPNRYARPASSSVPARANGRAEAPADPVALDGVAGRPADRVRDPGRWPRHRDRVRADPQRAPPDRRARGPARRRSHGRGSARSGGEPGAARRAARLEHRAAAAGAHPEAEPVLLACASGCWVGTSASRMASSRPQLEGGQPRAGGEREPVGVYAATSRTVTTRPRLRGPPCRSPKRGATVRISPVDPASITATLPRRGLCPCSTGRPALRVRRAHLARFDSPHLWTCLWTTGEPTVGTCGR